MRFLRFAVLGLAAAAPAGAQGVLSLERIFASPPPWGHAPSDISLSPDGERVLLAERRTMALYATATGKAVRLPFEVSSKKHASFGPFGHRVWLVRGNRVHAFDDGAPRTVLTAKRAVDELRRLGDGSLLARAGTEHWVWTRGSRRFTRLALPAGARLLATAKGARRLLFRIDKNAKESATKLATLGWLDGRRERAFTLSGSPRHTAFAPDGGTAAFVTLEPGRRGAPQLVPDFLTEEVTVKSGRAARTTDPLRLARLQLVRFRQNADTSQVSLVPGKSPAALPIRVVSIEFGPRGKRLLVQTISADYKTRRLLLVDRDRPGTTRLLHEEVDPKWIGPLARTALFDAKGTGVVFTSEVDDVARVFHVSVADGARPVALTPEKVLVDSCSKLAGNRLLVRLAHPDPARRFYGVVDVERRALLHPDQPPGWNESAVAAASADRLVFLHSRLFRPPEVWTTGLGGGRSRKVTASAPSEFVDYRWVRPQFVRYRSTDGSWIHAHLFMPKTKRPSRGWPAVIFLHGSGYLQNVRDSMTAYPADLLFHHRLAERGFVVLSPDFRGSAGYGRKFRTDVHKDLGGPDRRDVVAARRYLFDRCGVDLSRIGVYGGSYGGFLTLMCLFKDPRAFACGAALRPVTDWLRYHPRYVHPRLGRPDEPGGAEVYRKTSPIWFAAGLERPLLVLHGMRDDNVFVQDSVRLIGRLVEFGKDFDAMLYPSQGHRFTKPAAWVDEYRRIERLFDRTLR